MKAFVLHLMYTTLWLMMLPQLKTPVTDNAYVVLTAYSSQEVSRQSNENERVIEEMMQLTLRKDMRDSALPYFERACNIHKQCLLAVAFLDSIQNRIAYSSGGYQENSRILLHPHNCKWKQQVFKGPIEVSRLLDNIDTLNEFLIGNINSYRFSQEAFFLRERLRSSWNGDNDIKQEPNKKRIKESIYCADAAGAIAMLSGVKEYIVLSEYQILGELWREARPGCIFRFDAVASIAMPQNSYVTPGMSVVATIFIAEYDRQRAFEKIVASAGKITEIEDGIATWKSKAGPAGLHQIKGDAWIKTDSGLRKLPWAFSYMSGAPGADIHLHKAAIIYRGIGNPVTISHSAFATNELSLEVPGAEVTAIDDGRYTIRVIRPGFGKLMARMIHQKADGGRDTVVGMELTIKPPPLPTAVIGNEKAQAISAQTLRDAGAISLLTQDNDFPIRYFIISYEFSYLKKGTRDVVGPFSILGSSYADHPELKDFLRSASAGDKVFLTEISAASPGGNRIFPAPAVYTLE